MDAESDVNDLGTHTGLRPHLVAAHHVMFLVLQRGVLAVAMGDQRRALLVDAVRDQRHRLVPAVIATGRQAHLGEPVGDILRRFVITFLPGHTALSRVVRQVSDVRRERLLCN